MFHIKPENFYGSPSGSHNLETPRRVDPRIFLKHRKISLLSPSRTWKIFDRQDLALEFAKSRQGNGLITFVFHDDTGQRHFLVAHPHEFWLHDIEKDKSKRNSYEVIPEFTKCKLYLDLEFEHEYNPEKNGLEMTELFIKLIAHRLYQLYFIKVDRSMILDLDSSTPQKFSRHLIYQIPFFCFASNYEVGILVKEVCLWILSNDEDIRRDLSLTEDDMKTLIVKDRHGKDKLFCDEGVYTKNRHFRIYGSTKPNKDSHLVLSRENQFHVSSDNEKFKEELIFFSSLVTNFENIDIVCPLPEREQNILKTRHTITSKSNQNVNSKNLPSPYKILDNFALKEMEIEGIRCWVYFENTQCIIYEGYKAGYCGNIGREHKSNKGFLVIDLRKKHFYRKCHDPDCSGYQSEPKNLPNYIIASLQYPDCSEQERKEISDILDFLQSDNTFECVSAN